MNKWIKISDALPPLYEEVVVYLDDGADTRAITTGYWNGSCWVGHDSYDIDVTTHWQPLPTKTPADEEREYKELRENAAKAFGLTQR